MLHWYNMLQYLSLQWYQSQQLQHALLMNTYKAYGTKFQCQLVSSQKQKTRKYIIISNRLGLKVKTMKTMHKHVRVTSNSCIQHYLPDHWPYPSSLPSLGSCLHGSPSVRPSSSPRPQRRRSSSSGMLGAHSFGQAPSGSCCQAAGGIWEHALKLNSSSSGDWLNACRRSGAPSAPFVSVSKHLQRFVRINRLKGCWDCDTCRYTKTHPGQRQLIRQIHKSHHALEFQQLHTETNACRRKQEKLQHTSTISLCEALREICLLQVEPLGAVESLPRPCWDLTTVGKIQVSQLCRQAQHFK